MELEKILDHNWLSIYDCLTQEEAQYIADEKEEILEGGPHEVSNVG